MNEYKRGTPALDNGVYVIHNDEMKTVPEVNFNINPEKKNSLKFDENNVIKCNVLVASRGLIIHYLLLLILGLITWGFLWFAFGDEWRWNGRLFRVVAVAAVAWGSGHLLQASATLPPLMAALLTGIIARNVGYLDMRHYTEIDVFLRKIYPVVILGKASLGWDVHFMRKNWQLVATLGVVPWLLEVCTLAFCMRLLLNYPWIWGFLLGATYASVSCAVVMPIVQQLSAGKEHLKKWPQLVCTAGGTDTALSVGVFGVIHSVIFHEGDDDIYRYCKAAFALPLGVVLGVSWGSLAKFLPDGNDYYKTELRILFVLIGGLFASFLTSHYGWGGTAGVAVLACNATAATHWARDGWTLNSNPASSAYRVLWSALEPALFAYTGTFFVVQGQLQITGLDKCYFICFIAVTQPLTVIEIKHLMPKLMLISLGILVICLTVRLITAYVLYWDTTTREKLFFCCTWIPKSIVGAVLCPVALNTLIMQSKPDDPLTEYADGQMMIIVQAILVTTPIGYLLTKYLGPVLLKENNKKCENESES